MKPKSIGIIGGAGPLAGAFLLERILFLSVEKYGCAKDSDFPRIFFINYPFSGMLGPSINRKKLQKELQKCLKLLRKSGARVLGIACNDLSDLVHLPRTTAENIPPFDEPLVLCTSTSAQAELHKRFFPCTYPDMQTQQEVDGMIDKILKGKNQAGILDQLETLLEMQSAKTVVLGCTELSLFAARLSVKSKLIIDPLEIMANKILKKTFSNKKTKQQTRQI